MSAQSIPTPSPFWRRLRSTTASRRPKSIDVQDCPTDGHREFQEGQCGVSYGDLFGRYFVGARRIQIADPFIQQFHQVRNLMELLETIVRIKDEPDEVAVHLITRQSPPEFADKQAEYLGSVRAVAPTAGIIFSWEFDPFLHDRSIVTDHGWKIVLGRGLDIFQWYDVNNAFDFQNRMQIRRRVKGFTLTAIRAPRAN